MFQEDLIKLGFSEKEAAVYLTLLRNGPAPVSVLAKRTQLKRVSVYPILERLVERNLVTFEQTASGRRYVSYEPEYLLQALEKEHAELRYRIELAKSFIDEFHELRIWSS